MIERKTVLALAALPVVAIACLALGVRLARGDGETAASGATSAQLAEVMARLDAIERHQAEPGRGMPLSVRAARPAGTTPGERAHLERLRNDPDYAMRQEQQRLATLDKAFKGEPVDTRWASRVSAQVDDFIELANLQSRLDIGAGQVECRSQTCRINIDALPADKGYEDFVTYLTTEMAGVLPSARLVTISRPDGSRSVTIFARTATPSRNRD